MAATILVAVLLPVALASAQGVRPVGDVKDHPVPPRASSDEAEALLDELNLDDVPQESMQSLFNWAIEHSDPERLREMAAEAAAAGGRGGDGVGAASGAAVLSVVAGLAKPSALKKRKWHQLMHVR